MKQTGDKTTRAADAGAGVFVRACVVFASLVSLCVSDGIGPRLIPFPSGPPREVAARTDAVDASRLSAARAAIQAATDRQPKAVTPVWNDASPGRALLAAPRAMRPAPPVRYTPPDYSLRIPSATRGRAPPRDA